MPPVVVAFPDCFTRLGGYQYINCHEFIEVSRSPRLRSLPLPLEEEGFEPSVLSPEDR